jgi:cob(I)alamin adenosyltransferase
MAIYTKRGDSGQTDLFGGPRVAKDHLRVEVYGSVDELNAVLGLCAATTPHDDLRAVLHGIQARLFDLGSHLASTAPEHRRSAIAGPSGGDVAELEADIDALEEELAPLERFILPGGTKASAVCHMARTACRRAERRAVALHREEPLAEVVLRYLNRLSDLLFVMARVENSRAGESDVEWESPSR